MKDEVNKDWQKIAEQDVEQEQLESEELQEQMEDLSESQAAGLEYPGIAELEQKLTAAEQQAHENWEKSVRAMAELDNVRRRAERDVANAHKYGNEKFIDALLPVVDSLEQALQTTENEGSGSHQEGIALTLKLFLDVLEKFGVSQLVPLGEKFDPQVHEAISMVPMPDKESNTILEVFQKGYLLNERVVRPARVIVVKAP